MKKFEGILICTDLDGTLLRNDKSISAENSRAIEYFKDNGGLFTFVTGRMHYYAVDSYNKVKPNAPIGCMNGGCIYDFAKSKHIWKSGIDKEVTKLIDYVDKAFPRVGIQVNTFEKAYFYKDNETMMWFRKITGLENIQAHYNDIDEPWAKIIFGHEDENRLLEMLKGLESHPLAERFDFVHSEKGLMEIMPKGINKGVAIHKFSELLGIDKRKIIAVGDFENDVEMIKEAGVGVAVANACPAAKEVADIVTVSNEEHAIAKIIEDIEKGIITF